MASQTSKDVKQNKMTVLNSVNMILGYKSQNSKLGQPDSKGVL